MGPRHLQLLLAVFALPCAGACTPNDGTAPASSTPIATVSVQAPSAAESSTEPAPTADSSGATAEPSSTVTTKQKWIPEKPITARGKISKTPWQHLIGHVEGKQAEYFDLEDGGAQTVIYVAKAPNCPGTIEVQGLVYEVRGRSKRPGSKPTKVDDSYGELHIDVTSYRCLP